MAASTIKTPRSESKTAKAKKVFNEMSGAQRKDVIARFETEVGLTPKGASTYYQTLRKAQHKNVGMTYKRRSTDKIEAESKLSVVH